MEENIGLARQFLLEEFVSRGMIVDFAVHQPDKEGGISNPHLHVLCPIRLLNPDGTWGAKQHREYVLDEHGERIKDDAGHAVFNAVPTTDWGRPETLEHWRQAWADLSNAKFAEKKLKSHIDHRSYERQGVDQLPTVHEGVAVRQMEAKGIRTDKGDLNRWIKATNQLIRKVKQKLKELGGLLKEFQPTSSDLAQLLGEYYNIRNAGAYSTKAKDGNLKRCAEDFSFLQERNIGSVEQLQSYVSEVSAQVHDLNASIRSKSSRMKELNRLIRLAEDYARLKPVVDGIPTKGGFGKKREKYLAAHDSEIRQYYAVKRKLDSALPDKKLAPKAWQTELDQLSRAYAEESAKLKPIYADLKKLREIQAKINTAAHEQTHGRECEKGRGAEL
jgi:ATP-dependent exoDNAse (exonuclease V) alpha subunit